MSISQTEAGFHKTSLLKDSRADGRSRLEYRKIGISTGPAYHANGSCRVTLGPTEVLVGSRLETVDLDQNGKVSFDLNPNQQLFEFRVQYSTAASYSDSNSSDPSLNLANFLNDIYSQSLTQHSQFIIIPNKKAWYLTIDLQVIAGGTSGGNIKDLAAIGVKGALCDLRIPKTVGVGYQEDKSLQEGGQNDEIKGMMTSNRKLHTNTNTNSSSTSASASTAASAALDFDLDDYRSPGLHLENVLNFPLAVTLNIIDDYTFVDATQQEELSAPYTRFIAAFDIKSNVHAIKQEGENDLSIQRIEPLLNQASDICQQLQTIVNKQLRALNPDL